MHNKKGQLHIVLLLLVALALSISGLFIFLNFNRNFADPAQQRLEMLNELQFSKNYIMKSIDLSAKDAITQFNQDKTKDISVLFKNSIGNRNVGLDSMALFFGKIQSNEFSFSQNGDKYEFKMIGMTVYAKRGENEARSNFDIDLSFDSQGNLAS